MASALQAQLAMQQARTEMKATMDMYNRMAEKCMKKCVDSQFKESEMYSAEQVCSDRCVTKYMQVHRMIGELMAEQQQRMQAANQ